MKGRARRIALIAAVVVLGVAVRVLPVPEWLAALQGWVGGRGAWGGLAYGAAYVLAAILFVPGSLLTIGAGLLFGLLWGTIIVSVSSTTAAAVAFLLARHVARHRIEEMARGNRTFGAVDRAVRAQGWRMVALLRLSPLVPFSLSNYLYGLTPVAFGPYVLASWVAMLPATVLYVYLGAAGSAAAAAGRGQGRSPLEWALFASGLLATLAVTVMVTRAARRELEKGRLADPVTSEGPAGV